MDYSGMKKKITYYRLVLFDLDGTLYYQRPLRLAMARRLFFHYLVHPGRAGELFTLRKYRKIREAADRAGEKDIREQFEKAGRRYGLSAEASEKLIHYWMYEAPCSILLKYRDDRLKELMERLQERQVLTAVYSDYPVREKLEALSVRCPLQYCSADAMIGRMKPDPAGITAIMREHNIEPGDTLMIGDRMDKDGEAARAAGADWLILSGKPEIRREQLKPVFEGIG